MIKRFKTFIKTEKVIFKSLSDCLIQEKMLSASFIDTFNNILESYYFDLSYDNNYLLRYALKNKQFHYLDIFWNEKKVRDKLKEKNPYLYDYCNNHYEFKNAIIEGNTIKINEIMNKNASIISEKFFRESYIQLAVNNRKHRVVDILLSNKTFLTQFSWTLIEIPLINKDFDTLKSVLNSNVVEFSFCCERIINLLFSINKVDYYQLFNKNIKFKNRLEEMKSFEMNDYNTFMNGFKKAISKNIQKF